MLGAESRNSRINTVDSLNGHTKHTSKEEQERKRERETDRHREREEEE